MDAVAYLTLAVTLVVFTGIWLIHVAKTNAGVIDFYWGPGFVVIGAITLFYTGNPTGAQWVFLAAVTLWALRLTIHLGRRHFRSSSEDGRYAAMRREGGKSFWWASLFKIFLLQAVLLWLIASPVHYAMRDGNLDDSRSGLFLFGLLAFAFGLAIEWIADRQLETQQAAHGAHDTPVLVTSGLWSLCRHPNYLGEMILWWGLGLSALALSGSWLSLAGPFLLTVVMTGISIPLTEQHLRATRPSYEAYANRVPKLIPSIGRAQGAREKTGA